MRLLRELNEQIVNKEVDARKFWDGIRALRQCVRGRLNTNSWAYPTYVVALFFTITWGLVVCGSVATIVFINANGGFVELGSLSNLDKHTHLLLLLAVIVLVVPLRIWCEFIAKVGTLMVGSSTVDSFFLRFLPIRAGMLNSEGLRPCYVQAAERLREARRINLPKVG
jgi:hypothetical protein